MVEELFPFPSKILSILKDSELKELQSLSGIQSTHGDLTEDHVFRDPIFRKKYPNTSSFKPLNNENNAYVVDNQAFSKSDQYPNEISGCQISESMTGEITNDAINVTKTDCWNHKDQIKNDIINATETHSWIHNNQISTPINLSKHFSEEVHEKDHETSQTFVKSDNKVILKRRNECIEAEHHISENAKGPIDLSRDLSNVGCEYEQGLSNGYGQKQGLSKGYATKHVDKRLKHMDDFANNQQDNGNSDKNLHWKKMFTKSF